MIEIAAAVETHTFDALLLRPRRDLLSDELAGFDLPLRLLEPRRHLFVHRRAGEDRPAREIVAQPGVDMVQPPEHGEVRPFARCHDLLLAANVTPGAARCPG